MGQTWRAELSALALLDVATLGPFASAAGRKALESGLRGWRSASFGAVLDQDGTEAAVALFTDGTRADSVPWGYGGIVSSRTLARGEVDGFLRQAAAEAGVRAVYVRSIPALGGVGSPAGGRVKGATHVIQLEPGTSPDKHFTPKAAQSIRRAERAGCVVQLVDDPSDALALYRTVAGPRGTIYPSELIIALVRAGVAAVYEVRREHHLVAVLIGLCDPSHWMYWIAAQTDAGRKSEAGYLALAAFVRDAHAAGALAVNLGMSEGLPGVAKFKRRFGAREVPVVEHRCVAFAVRTQLRANLELNRLKGLAVRAFARPR